MASLQHNYPNPFSSQTTIPFRVGIDGPVTIQLYDLAGQRIRTLVQGEHQAGTYKVLWDGRDNEGRSVATGVYLVHLLSHGYREISKITLIK